MSIKKVFTGDRTADGYKDGIKDGKQGVPKSHYGTLKRNPFNYFWKADNASDSYSKGYNTGYTDGQRILHKVYSSHTGGGMTDLERQVHILEQAKGQIKHHQNILEQANGLYGKQVRAMHGAGFVDNYTNELAARYDRLDKTVEQVLDELQRQLTVIETFQEALYRMIEDAKGN